ncbi:hypothetical protein BX600DRAFT_509764 [Xylariales sp. PMI_506]|nr:hypothetical protein BX600DRAFT_509764 [Xylariales sp. PMI_506]
MSGDTFVYSFVNFDDPTPAVNNPSTLLGFVISFLIISWICVTFRLYVRFKVVRSPGWDDLFVALYLATTTVGCVSICVAVIYGGLGQHVLLLSTTEQMTFSKAFYVCNATYCFATTFIKLALLFQYLRVFNRGTISYRITVGLIGFVALWGLAYSAIAWIPCVPVTDFWSVFSDGSTCYGYGSHNPRTFVKTYESHAIVNMLLDGAVLALPFPLLWKEGSSRSDRLRLVALLSMGSLVIALCTWRLQTMVATQVASYPTRDPTWYGPIEILLAALEVNAASICASVPIFWPVLSNNWSGIFVTQEVKVTHEARYNDDDRDSLAPRASQTEHHGRTDSETELSIIDSPRGTNKHYRDSFVLRQVDPLRLTDVNPVITHMQDEPGKRNQKWIRF